MSYLSDTDNSPPRASSSRDPSAAPSFLGRLRSTVSPSADESGRAPPRSRASNSIFDEDSSYGAGQAGIDAYEFSDMGDPYQPSDGGYPGSEYGGDRGGDGGDGGEDFDDLDMDVEDMDDVKKMGLVWARERGTTDIMPWEEELVESLLDKLEQQGKMVDALRSDPKTSEEEHFKLMLVQTEMERVKYLVRSYVRTRLHKIEKFSHYITLNPETHSLLSASETTHARRYTELLHTHFQHSVLESLPEKMRRMDESFNDGVSMVSQPNLDTPVLIYCRKDCGEVPIGGDENASLSPGTTHLIKYSLVASFIKLGEAEVI
ncbi:hypothetical protein IAT38_003945 [Cryptococcus sp. DSM 104549]